MDVLDSIFYVVIVLDVDLFVFDTSPQTLNKNIVQSAPCTVHADADACVFQDLCKVFARELTSLIAVEYLRCLFS